MLGGGGEPTGGGRPPYSIAFDTAVQARNVTITGNTFNWVTRSPVYFAAAASEVTISPTGIKPTVDNARDLGSAESRMRTVYAHGVQFAPGPRPQPAAGAMAMVTDAAGGSVLAVSDGTTWRRIVLGNPV